MSLKYTYAIIFKQNNETICVKSGDYLKVKAMPVLEDISKIMEGKVSYIDTYAESFTLENGNQSYLVDMDVSQIIEHKPI